MEAATEGVIVADKNNLPKNNPTPGQLKKIKMSQK